MNEKSIEAISDIIASFDMGELHTLLSDQINNEDDDYISPVIDQYEPLYREFMSLNNIKEEDQEDVQIIKEKFYRISRMIITLIAEKFDFTIDEDYLNDNQDKVPAICLALYTFFVIDIYSVIYALLTNYFTENMIELYEVFKDAVQNKDSVTTSNKKMFSDEMASLISNIYDITDYIFTNIDIDNYNQYLDKGYLPAMIINTLRIKGEVSGDFIRTIADIYKTNIALKSKVCFDIIYKIKDGVIEDVFKLLNNTEVTDDGR